MKKGLSLTELAQKLTAINEAKKDFIVPVEKLSATVNEDNNVCLQFDGVRPQKLNNWSTGQLASFAEIPKQYLDRVSAENPTLAASNINHGLSRKPNDTRMLRTLDGNVRGLLSSRYRILDSYDMLESVLPTMLEKNMNVVSSEVTENKLYLKALTPQLKSEITKGDVVQHGLIISTSDVGAGSVRVEPLIYRLVCENGLIMPSSIRKYHVGKNQAENDIMELLTDKTREMTDAAFWAQVRDIVNASLRPELFEKEVDRLRFAQGLKIENFDLPKVVELAMKATNVTGEIKKNSILAALASGNEGAGLTQWGLINSFTRAAQNDAFDYETGIELERAAGQILELNPNQWRTIAVA